MNICNEDPYQDYYRIVKVILKYLYLSQGKDISDTFTFDSFSMKPTNRFNDIAASISIVDSCPTGSRAYESMKVSIKLNTHSVKNFTFRYSRLKGYLELGWIKTETCEVPYSFFSCKSDKLEDIVDHVEKFMKFHLILPLLKDMYGKNFSIDEMDDSLYEMISMYKI